MARTANVPFLDGKGESYSNIAQDVELRSHAANFGPMRKASALTLNVGPVARQVCMVAGSDQITHPDGTMEITRASTNSSAPGAAGTVYQEVGRFLQFTPAAQAMGEYWVRSDLLQRKVESKMQMGAAVPETFVWVFCAQGASPSQRDKSLALASA